MPNESKPRRWLLWAAGGLTAGLIVLGLALIALILLARSTSTGTLPQVELQQQEHGPAPTAGETLVVRARAVDPDGIAFIEFWANGRKIGTQETLEPGSTTFQTSQAWRPEEAGSYTLYARAQDEAGFSGDTAPLIIEVQAVGQAPETSLQVFVDEGGTLDELAQRLSVPAQELRERNPNLGAGPVPPGSSVYTPASDEPDDDENQSGNAAQLAPSVGRPTSGAGAGTGQPAVRVQPPAWASIVGSFTDPANVCPLAPILCGRSSANPPQLQAPSDLTVDYQPPGCEVRLSWNDRSDSEQGFRVYRQTHGAARSNVLAELEALPGQGERISFLDAAAPTGRHVYFVTAVHGSSQAPGPASDPVEVHCPVTNLDAVTLVEIEVVEMLVSRVIDRAYCYVSLAGAPHERVPLAETEYLIVEDSEVPIQDHLGGRSSRQLLVPQGQALDLDVQCLGWREDQLEPLGGFTRSHPPDSWGDTLRTAGPDDGLFTVAYRIRRVQSQPDGEAGARPMVDNRLPPPFDLSAHDLWYDCSISATVGSCRQRDEPGLTWQVVPPPEWPADLRDGLQGWGYRVYAAAERGDPEPYFSHLPTAAAHGRRGRTAPRLESCRNEGVTYSVSLVLLTEGGEVESPRSSGLRLNHNCQLALEVNLETLQVHDVRDPLHGPNLEAYGSIAAYHQRDRALWFLWNEMADHREAFTSIQPNTLYFWQDMELSLQPDDSLALPGDWAPTRGFETNNTVGYFPLEADKPLRVEVWLSDWDASASAGFQLPGSGSPSWCYKVITLEGREAEDWLGFEQDLSIHGQDDSGSCTVGLMVRAVPAQLVGR